MLVKEGLGVESEELGIKNNERYEVIIPPPPPKAVNN